MAISPPPIDDRTAPEIAAQLRSLLAFYYPKAFRNPNTGEPQVLTGVNAALVQVMARFAEIIIQRLNRVPERNFLAFLDLLGAAQLPPQPARVPLTFTLTTGTTGDAIVPSGTQVAASTLNGSSEITIFETEKELIVTSAQLVSVLVRDPVGDRYADQTAALLSGNSTSIAAFQGDLPIDHVFYIGHSQLLSFPEIQNLQIQFNAVQPLGDDAMVQWQVWNGTEWIGIAPTNPQAISQSGHGQLNFTTVQAVPISLVNGITNRWLRCRLLAPITPTSQQLLSLQNLSLQATLNRTGLMPEMAFTNQLPIDLTKELYPFGEKPKFGDTFYLAHREVFGLVGASIMLNISIINAITASVNLTLIWECWNGQIWLRLGTTNKNGAIAPLTNNFSDTTNALTKTGTVTFTLPTEVKLTTVNGVENAWFRVRIIDGDYGTEASYEKKDDKYEFQPASFTPPIVRSIRVDYQLMRSAAPEVIITENDFVYSENLAVSATQAFTPFQATKDTQPTLYLGFTLPPGRLAFPNRPINLYIKVPELSNGRLSREALRLAWDYFNGEAWQTLAIRDETAGFSRSGLVEVLIPANFTPSIEFGRERYWLRVRLLSNTALTALHLQRLLLNTTMAVQAQTLHNEILGSSDGTESQIFRTTHAPILDGQHLDVQEFNGWIRWQEVIDFYGSAPRDRHYILNHLTGEIHFGDGQQGMIPPPGRGNIRLTRYQTGGGAAGNRNPGAISQLKTTVPFIKAVTNYEAATGGTDAESLASLRDRIPRQLRHRYRAVTVEDYEDLAMQASPEVARAKCVPLHNLVVNPVITSETPTTPGVLSVIVVPNSDAPNPSPSLELLDRVQSYLDRRRLPNADLVVVGPEYVRVDVTTEVALVSLDSASSVEVAVRQTLDRFLHPLTGGLNGKGWDFGREPYKSDLYALLEAVPGVDRIHSLSISPTPESSQFLVYSGNHTINLTI
ncbi:putative baseplate assembly protein [Scytonema sp. UIC 10036]|uniref:putative baseplate assembly protein n=1 Tax=Scytonema sp. UIC 10036 TaxID=2304196 RepID=UPI0012DA49C6|nr:putative baseplate assembly protein [Scytonema sp. UIC 10036]MUG93211.1 putative baseplate assembly protein [Scytonema sp. UIC 10036]